MAARSAVIVKWFFSRMARIPAAAASRDASMSSTDRGRESGPVWKCRSTTPSREISGS